MKRKRAIPGAVLKLRKRIDAWRSTRQKQEAMPESLWSEAAELAGEHGMATVCEAAGLGYAGLKKRMPGGGQEAVSEQQSFASPFVELPLAALRGSQQLEAAVVELRDANGRSLSVRMMPEALPQLSEVTNALWGLS